MLYIRIFKDIVYLIVAIRSTHLQVITTYRDENIELELLQNDIILALT